MKSGIHFVMDQTNFHRHFFNKIDLIITGEGSVDKQTLDGKVVKGMDVVHKIHQAKADGQYHKPRIKIYGIRKVKP